MKSSNVLRIESLSEDWKDKDSVMLHACFQLLKDCVEKENLINGHTEWNADKKHMEAKKEIEDLYDWWCTYSEGDLHDDEDYELQNRMLIRLINIRWALWT